MLSAPSGIGRTGPSPRTRGSASFTALAFLFTLLCSALPAWAQSWSANLAVTEPTFVALDTVGGTTYLYVSEHGDVPVSGAMPSNGGRILKYNLSTGVATAIAARGTGDGQFISPDAIVVNPTTHNLYIADRYLDRVQEITNTGTFVRKWGSGTVGAANEMHGPVGLARDSSGALYVSEHGSTNSATVVPGNMVSKYTFDGSGNPVFQWRKGNGLNAPYSVAVNGSNLYISDGFNHQIQVWDLNGTPLGSFPTSAIALGASFDAAGNLWVAESAGDTGSPQQIVKRNPTNGASLMAIGTEGSGNLQFQLPFDVAVDSTANKAYVADYHNNRVEVISLAASSGSVPVISGSATASGTVGVPFSYTITASNSPTSYAVSSGTLPAGVSLNASTGVISGTPSAASSGTVNLTATNATGTSTPFALAITISAAPSGGDTTAPTISSFTFDLGTVTASTGEFVVVFSEPVTGVDASDFAFTMQGNATTTITGVTPTSSTTYRVAFNYGGTTGSVQLGIKSSGTGIVDAANNAFVGGGQAAADPVPFQAGPPADPTAPTVASFTGGTPSGSTVNFTLQFSEAVSGVDAADFLVTRTGSATATIGAISGSGTTYTIPVTFGGSGTIQLTVIGGVTANIRDAATNWFEGGANATSNAVTVGSTGTAPAISNQTASGTVNVALSYPIVATGATSYSIVGTPALPAGLSLNTTTGVVSGVPTASGTTAVTVRATNATGSTDAQLTFTIAAASSAPTIANQTASGTQNATLTYQVVATGATSYAIVGSTPLPAGLTLNATSGVISGTPTSSGTTAVTVRATNATGSTDAQLTITIAAAGSAPVMANQTANGTVNVPMNYQVVATGATSYSLVGTTALPTGLSLNTTTGVVSGTPTASGTTTVTLRASNANGNTNATLTITVASAGGAPVVSAKSVNGTVGIPMSFSVTATNSPTSYAISGQPAGITINSSGVVSGIPTAAGTFNTTVTATNATGSGTGTVTLVIAPASTGGGGGVVIVPPPPPPPPALKGQTVLFNTPVNAIVVGQPVKLSATSDSGGPITYTIISGNALLSGDTLTMVGVGPVVIRASQAGNTTWAAASHDATFTAQKASQAISIGSTPLKVYTDGTVALKAASNSGLPITYTVVSGPATVSGTTLTFTGSGPVVVRATQAGNDTYASTDTTMTITGSPIPRLVNISSRLKVSSGDAGAAIAGFVVTGTTPKQILIRAVGPGLSSYGIGSPLANPTMTLYRGTTQIATNSGWSDDAKITAAGDGVGAFRLKAGSKDAALLVTLDPGAYTAVVQSASSSGTVLIEVYDVTANAAVPTKQLINISTRGNVGTNDDVLVGGFVVSGTEPKRVLVRAIGPGLASYGVTGLLANPVLKVYELPTNTLVAQNDNWGTALKAAAETPATAAEITAANTAAGAFPLAAGSNDAAVIMTLDPGAYTAVVSGANNTTGAALIEVYELPNL